MRHCAVHSHVQSRDYTAVSGPAKRPNRYSHGSQKPGNSYSLWHEERKRRCEPAAKKLCASASIGQRIPASTRRPRVNRQVFAHSSSGDAPLPAATRSPPTAKQLLLFALPTLILPLADPLMSLIDTVCIGMYGTVVELAATGPASLLFAAPAVLFSALSATALTDISGAQARGDAEAAEAAFARALRDAAVAGTLTMLLFGLFSKQVVGVLGVAPDVLPLAAGYVAVRALAAPATMASSVYSAALLAQRDSRSPGVVVAFTAAFNLVADIALIVGCGLGLTGAAVATVATQYLSLAALAFVCRQPGRLSPDFASLLHSPPAPLAVPSAPTPVADGPPASAPPGGAQVADFAGAGTEIGALEQEAHGAGAVEQAEGAGDAQGAAKGKGGSGGTLALVYAAKLLCYFLVQGAAMRLEVVGLAAHNAVFSVWNACAYFPLPLQTTALAFVPACASFPELRHVVKVLTAAAAALAVPLALACCVVPLHLPHLLTSDPAVVAALRPLAPTAGAAILLCTLDVACEGILVAQGRLRLLIAGMSAVLVAVGAYFWAGYGASARGTWRGLLMFFALRCALSSSGVLYGMLRGEQDDGGNAPNKLRYA